MPIRLIPPLSLVISLVIVLVWPVQAGAGPMSFSNLFVYGDSLSDTGNSYLATLAETPPSPNPVYYPNVGHYTDGATYGELMWQALSLPGGLQPSLAGGTNFAVGGARSRYGSPEMSIDAGSGLNLPPPPGTPDAVTPGASSLLAQVGGYLLAAGGIADPFALYVIWIGGNDARDAATLTFSPRAAEAPLLLQQSVGDVADAVVSLIMAGARNLLLPSVSNIGLTPEAQALDTFNPGVAATLSGWAEAYNHALDAALDAALDSLVGIDGLRLRQVDTFDRLGDVLASPARYGLANVADPCLSGYFVNAPTGGAISLCSAPETYAYYDAVHPSSTVHAILARDFLAAVPVPAPLVLMLGGLVLLGAGRRGRARA